MRKTVEEKFKPYIGCPVVLDTRNGNVVIFSKGRVEKMTHMHSPVGIFVGIREYAGAKRAVISFTIAEITYGSPTKYIKIV